MTTAPYATLRALSDPIRLAIVDRVAGGTEVTATQLAEVLPITRQAIARHIGGLEEAGILVGTRRGREHRYRVDLGPMRDAREWLARREASWDGALRRLADYLESDG